MLISRICKFVFTLAVASLALNDVVRLACPEMFQQVYVFQADEEQDDNNPTSTLFEEEVKHKAMKDRLEMSLPVLDMELDAASAHLIADDEVRHLAFLPIFSPPPNLG